MITLMKKYNLVLVPSLKKNWIHFDIEVYEDGNDDWAVGYHYSKHYAGCTDYLAFRPDVERDVEEIINENKANLDSLMQRCYSIYFNRKVENLRENIKSIKVRNPIYYCLKSKLVWQDVKNDKLLTDKLIEIKTLDDYHQKEEDTIVAECQRQRLEQFYECGSFVEISRKHIREYKKLDAKILQENLTSKEYQNGCLSIFYGIMCDVKDNCRI